MPTSDYDVAVIGAGLVGLTVARELRIRHPTLRLAVIEREAHVASHQSGHNSGVIHAGIYYKPGSLKARLCVDGAQRMYAYCEDNEIPVKRCGKLIIAIDKGELPALDDLEARGKANGLDGLRRLNSDEIREVEVHARGIEALHSPSTGVVNFGRVARAVASEIEERDVSIQLGTAVDGIDVEHGQTRLRLKDAETGERAELTTGYVINCAGAWADHFAVQCGASPDPRIVPFRGQYLLLRPNAERLVKALIYPVPDPALPFLGVHFTRRINGDVLLGPGALLAGARDAYSPWQFSPTELLRTFTWPGTWRMAQRWWRTGAKEILHTVSKSAYAAEGARYIPALLSEDVMAGPSGVRGQAVARDGTLIDDFVIAQTERVLHIRNAPSPAGTASFALADLIVDEAESQFSLAG